MANCVGPFEVSVSFCPAPHEGTTRGLALHSSASSSDRERARERESERERDYYYDGPGGRAAGVCWVEGGLRRRPRDARAKRWAKSHPARARRGSIEGPGEDQ